MNCVIKVLLPFLCLNGSGNSFPSHKSVVRNVCWFSLRETSSVEAKTGYIFPRWFHVLIFHSKQKGAEFGGILGQAIVILVDCELRLSPDVWMENVAPPRPRRL